MTRGAATACARASVVAYVVSFALPVGDLGSGVLAFLMSLRCWLDVASWFSQPASLRFALVWLANPAYWLGWVWRSDGRTRRAAIAGGVAFVLGLLAVPAGLSEDVWPGYWCWLAGLALFAIAAEAESRAARIAPGDAARP